MLCKDLNYSKLAKKVKKTRIFLKKYFDSRLINTKFEIIHDRKNIVDLDTDHEAGDLDDCFQMMDASFREKCQGGN